MEFQSTGLNQPIDMSVEFDEIADNFFFASHTDSFDPEQGSGTLQWKRYARKPRLSFNQMDYPFTETPSWEFPEEYQESPTTGFALTFLNDRTIRLRIGSRPSVGKLLPTEPSLMLDPSRQHLAVSWDCLSNDEEIIYSSRAGSITIRRNPWKLILRDASGHILTETRHFSDCSSLLNTNGIPFSFKRSSADLSCRMAASFMLRQDEKLFGAGESFTRLNKRGQKLNLFTTDALSVQTQKMYKPVPFFMSSAGYGMFVHTSAPLTFDFGAAYDDTNTIYTGEESMDLFLFIGSPKEILAEYTMVTGRSPLPPLWSFGLWMSRITYSSEEEVREVASKLQENEIPCDVIHLDTGWFETEWRCNYEFSRERFGNPEVMISDLKKQGYRISLWQLPYFTPNNSLYEEILEKGYAVKTTDGRLPTDDVILDFSNPEAAAWYQEQLAGLLRLGVSAIKVDFGEAAPLNGMYASGLSGFHEHNLYPLRYNRAAAEITKSVNDETIIWARSAWAGSQRYPIHWGGDAENTDSAMASSLRAGLSLGLSGFSFWSHDIGGFVHSCPEELYSRWLPFGMLTSHSRCHGAPPTEPWAYSEEFILQFRQSADLKYALIPYIYTQAKLGSDQGYPMLRALFLEFPEDPGSWLVEDQYMFGSDLLVAPLFEPSPERQVYLPPGGWFDYQTGLSYEGGRWHKLSASKLPIIILVRAGAVIPHARSARSTAFLDWNVLNFVVYAEEGGEDQEYRSSLFDPRSQFMHEITVIGGSIHEVRQVDGGGVPQEGWKAQHYKSR